jgi:hypothetical protein
LLAFGYIDLYVWSWTEYEIFAQGTATKVGTVLFAKDQYDDPNDAEGPFFKLVDGACASAEQTESINQFIELLELYKSKSKLDDIESFLEEIQQSNKVM